MGTCCSKHRSLGISKAKEEKEEKETTQPSTKDSLFRNSVRSFSDSDLYRFSEERVKDNLEELYFSCVNREKTSKDDSYLTVHRT